MEVVNSGRMKNSCYGVVWVVRVVGVWMGMMVGVVCGEYVGDGV